MTLTKINWALRAVFYKLYFKSIGFPSYIGRPLYIAGARRIRCGRMTRIYPGARLECLGAGEIVFGSNISVGQRLHIISSYLVSIGSNCLLAENIFISDSDHSFLVGDAPYQSQPLIVSRTFIGENCFIGYGAVILAGTKLGNNCVVGAYSVLRGSYPDNTMLAGSPARVIKTYNKMTNKWVKYED